MDWEYTDRERELFARELDDFVPPRVFDAHAHLYDTGHMATVLPYLAAGPPVVDLAAYRERMAQIMPGRRLSGLFFGYPMPGLDLPANNALLAREAARDPDSRALMLVRPDMDPEEIRETVRRDGFVGLKCYHVYAPEQPTFNAAIPSYLPEEQVRIAHEEGLAIMLHMVRPRALADPLNQEVLHRYATAYPNARFILAHAARGFNPHHTVEGIAALEGLRNVWCDTSAVTECGAFEAIVRTLGADRLLYGSDFPVSHQCGRCVAIGDSFLWLSPENTRFEAAYADVTPTLVGLESLRVLKLACLNLGLTDSQVEAVFWSNARAMLGLPA